MINLQWFAIHFILRVEEKAPLAVLTFLFSERRLRAGVRHRSSNGQSASRHDESSRSTEEISSLTRSGRCMMPAMLNLAAPYIRYATEVLGVRVFLRPGEETAPQLTPLVSSELFALEALGALREARAALVSIYPQWPPHQELVELRSRIVAALKLGSQATLEIQARKPASADEARALSQEIGQRLRDSGAELTICFGRWALACVENDPSHVVQANAGPAMGMVSTEGYLLTHDLHALLSDPQLKRDTWQHLQAALSQLKLQSAGK